MIIQKYIPTKKKYINYEIPKEWNVKLYCDDINEKINCVSCGKEITYERAFTSKMFHNSFGIGYCECDECYFKNFDEIYNNS